MPKGECPHCGGQLGAHYHSPKTGKDVCCLKCSKRSPAEFEKDKAATDPRFMKKEKDHASWPKDTPWPWDSFDVKNNNFWVESKSGAPAILVNAQKKAPEKQNAQVVSQEKAAKPEPEVPVKEKESVDVKA